MNENLYKDDAGNWRVKPCKTVVTASGIIKGAGEIVTVTTAEKQENTEGYTDGVQQ
jgi:hypothetical protein